METKKFVSNFLNSKIVEMKMDRLKKKSSMLCSYMLVTVNQKILFVVTGN